ncbi:amino acid kinase family protein, partial [Rheinheimera pleomorphica]
QLHSLGMKVVLVYGARPQINAALQQAGLEPTDHNRVRVTDDDSFQLIKQVAGALQLEITARLSMSLSNTPMQGAQINVVSGNFVIAQPLGVDEGVDSHHSGRVRRMDAAGIRRQVDYYGIVLRGPIAASVTGE